MSSPPCSSCAQHADPVCLAASFHSAPEGASAPAQASGTIALPLRPHCSCMLNPTGDCAPQHTKSHDGVSSGLWARTTRKLTQNTQKGCHEHSTGHGPPSLRTTQACEASLDSLRMSVFPFSSAPSKSMEACEGCLGVSQARTLRPLHRAVLPVLGLDAVHPVHAAFHRRQRPRTLPCPPHHLSSWSLSVLAAAELKSCRRGPLWRHGCLAAGFPAIRQTQASSTLPSSVPGQRGRDSS